MTLDPDMSMKELVDVVERVAKLGANDAFLELSINGIVFRIYPSRIEAGTEKDRLKLFVVFVRALMRMVKDGDSEFILRANFDSLEIGVHQDVYGDATNWMPCEIDRIDLPVTPPSFSVPTFEDDASDAPRMPTLRKIIL